MTRKPESWPSGVTAGGFNFRRPLRVALTPLMWIAFRLGVPRNYIFPID